MAAFSFCSTASISFNPSAKSPRCRAELLPYQCTKGSLARGVRNGRGSNYPGFAVHRRTGIGSIQRLASGVGTSGTEDFAARTDRLGPTWNFNGWYRPLIEPDSAIW